MTTQLPYGDLSGDFDPPITTGPGETLAFGIDGETYAFILYGADGQARLVYRRCEEDGVYRLSATP